MISQVYKADRWSPLNFIKLSNHEPSDVVSDTPEILSEKKTTVRIFRTLAFRDGYKLTFEETARLGRPRKDGSRLVGAPIRYEFLSFHPAP